MTFKKFSFIVFVYTNKQKSWSPLKNVSSIKAPLGDSSAGPHLDQNQGDQDCIYFLGINFYGLNDNISEVW